MTLDPLRKNIIFSFVDEATKFSFRERTDWGFVITGNYDDALKRGRLAIVEIVGPEVPDEIKVGSIILIEPLKWTTSFDLDGKKVWQTTSDHVLAIIEQ